MADINEQVVGSAAPKKDNQKNARLKTREFKLKTSISDEQYAQAHFQEFYRRTGVQLVVIMAIVLVAQGLISGTFTDPETSVITKAGLILVALGAFLVMPMIVKTRWQHIKRNNDFWVNEQSYVLNGKGLAVKSNHGDRRLQWRELQRIFEVNDTIIFTLYKFHIIVLPLGGFSDEEKQQIREIVLHNTRNLRVKAKLQKSKA